MSGASKARREPEAVDERVDQVGSRPDSDHNPKQKQEVAESVRFGRGSREPGFGLRGSKEAEVARMSFPPSLER